MHPTTVALHRAAIIGWRKDGRPIRVIRGGSEPPPEPPTPPTPPGPVPTPPTPTPERTFSQAEVSAMLAREKDQGARKHVAEALGFESLEAARTWVEQQRQAEQSRMTEEQRRQAELEQRETAIAARDAETKAAARDVRIRGALLAAGSAGDDQNDAAVLIAGGLAADADDAAVTAAVDALKARRPELFGGTAPTTAPNSRPPAPPGTPPPPPGEFGAAGAEEARRRGFISTPAT